MFLLIAIVECVICALMFLLPPRWAGTLIVLLWAPVIAICWLPTDGRDLFSAGLVLGPFGLVMLLLSVLRAAHLLCRAFSNQSYRPS